MGEVYRAHDQVLHRKVALKLLGVEEGEVGPQTSTPAVQNMLREARHAAALTHPNIVALFDVGEANGRPFLVMELVSGGSLRTYVGSEVGAASRLSWLADVARALAAAHRIGLVHRDIKPENVLVSDEGVAKVLDFGIARRDEAMRTPSERRIGADFHRAGTQGRSLLAGTPGYMAPELLTGHATDARVDQFAWGVMAYELLSGRSPWGDDPEHLMHALLHVEPAALDAATLGLGADVASVVARAMRKSPDARFPTMDALLAALESPAGEGVRASAAPVRPPERASASSTLATAFEPHATTGSGGTQGMAVDSRRARRRIAPLAVATALTVGALGGALLLVRPSPPIASASAGLPVPSLPTTSSQSPAASDPPLVVPPPPPATATVAPPPRPSPRHAPPHPVDSAGASPASLAPTALPPVKPAPSCDPPFTLDGEGRKHFKPECYLTP
jgi:serine/threonine protein kinase